MSSSPARKPYSSPLLALLPSYGPYSPQHQPNCPCPSPLGPQEEAWTRGTGICIKKLPGRLLPDEKVPARPEDVTSLSS